MRQRTKTTATRRVPNEHVALALGVVGSLLDEVQPQNVDRAAITFTEEGDAVGIVLIPHRDLAGLSLVVWVDVNYIDVSWAAVSDLHHHDEIDLGKSVFRVARSHPEWETMLRSQITSEFRRDIKVTRRRGFLRSWALWCTIELEDRPTDLYVTGISAVRTADKSKIVALGDTSLQGPEAPTASYPVPLGAWLKYATAPWPAE
jgi:hypothetical protein